MLLKNSQLLFVLNLPLKLLALPHALTTALCSPSHSFSSLDAEGCCLIH